MTLDELKTLNQGEIVVLTKVDEKITEYHNYQVGDELAFYNYDELVGQVDFIRNTLTVSHFSYDICDYIERKVVLERNNKLNSLGI